MVNGTALISVHLQFCFQRPDVPVWIFQLKEDLCTPDGWPVMIQPVPGSEIVGSAELRKRKHQAVYRRPPSLRKNQEKRLSRFFVRQGARLYTGYANTKMRFSFASSPLSESLEQASDDQIILVNLLFMFLWLLQGRRQIRKTICC